MSKTRRLKIRRTKRNAPEDGSDYALVDAEDYRRLSKYVWKKIIAGVANGGKFYIARAASENPVRYVRLVREVLGVQNEEVAVHFKNRNPLDFRKSNLRPVFKTFNRVKKLGILKPSVFFASSYGGGKKWRAALSYRQQSVSVGS